MGLGDDPNDAGGTTDGDGPEGRMRRTAARCWALLLARIYECLPLLCPTCGHPMRIIAVILERPVIEKDPRSYRRTDGGTSGLTGPAAPAGRDGIRPGSGARGMAGHGSDGRDERRDLGVNHRKETRGGENAESGLGRGVSAIGRKPVLDR